MLVSPLTSQCEFGIEQEASTWKTNFGQTWFSALSNTPGHWLSRKVHPCNDPGSFPKSLFPYILPHTTMPISHPSHDSYHQPTFAPRPNLPQHTIADSYHNKPDKGISDFISFCQNIHRRTELRETTKFCKSTHFFWHGNLIFLKI